MHFAHFSNMQRRRKNIVGEREKISDTGAGIRENGESLSLKISKIENTFLKN